MPLGFVLVQGFLVCRSLCLHVEYAKLGGEVYNPMYSHYINRTVLGGLGLNCRFNCNDAEGSLF